VSVVDHRSYEKRCDDTLNVSCLILATTSTSKVSRMYYVHPSAGELFYLRVLLMIVKGARNYVDVRTSNNRIYITFREACDTRGLLESDIEWDILFDEAIVSASSYQLREVFVMVVLQCSVSNVHALFDKYLRLHLFSSCM
jgi:hypothetical protein